MKKALLPSLKRMYYLLSEKDKNWKLKKRNLRYVKGQAQKQCSYFTFCLTLTLVRHDSPTWHAVMSHIRSCSRCCETELVWLWPLPSFGSGKPQHQFNTDESRVPANCIRWLQSCFWLSRVMLPQNICKNKNKKMVMHIWKHRRRAIILMLPMKSYPHLYASILVEKPVIGPQTKIFSFISFPH